MQAPGGEPDFKYPGWTFEFDRGEDGNQFKLEETKQSDGLLIGRRTYAASATGRASRLSATTVTAWGIAASRNRAPSCSEPAWRPGRARRQVNGGSSCSSSH